MLLAGCSSTTAVDLTIQLGGDVAAGEIAQMNLHVDGEASPFDRTIDVHGKFGSGRETLQYLPGVSSGTLAFTITLVDDGAITIGHGTGSVPLKSHGSVALTIPIGADVAMEDMASADMTGSTDAAMPTCTRIQVTTFAGTGASGYLDGAGNVAQFQNLEGITVDPQGTLFAAEGAHVRKILADGTVSTFSSTTYLLARRISRSNVGEFHVADSANDQVYRVPSGGGNPIMDLVQGGVITVADNQTDGKPYIWDTQTCQIQTVNASNALIHFSGAATCGLADGNATTGQFTAVPDLVFDGAGILWVADQFRIRRVAADGSITTLAGSTQGHTDATGAAAQFQSPLGITLDDAAHVLYVTDGTTIRVVTMGGAVTTLVGSTAGFVDGDGCVAKFGALKGITYFAGALYAVDVERIRKIVLP